MPRVFQPHNPQVRISGTTHPGPVGAGPRTTIANNAAPRGSGARQIAPYQTSGLIFAQRTDGLDNTLGLGVTGRRLIVQSTRSTRHPEICKECQWWTAHVVAHFIAGDGGLPVPSRQDVIQGQRVSPCQVLLEYSDGSGQRQEVFLDIGPGFGMSFFGAAPKIWLLLDSTMAVYSNIDGGQASDLPAVTLTTSLIEATLQCSRDYTGPSRWQASIVAQNPANTITSYQILPRAQYVEVFQSVDGPPATELQINPGSRIYTFSPAGGRYGPRVRVPGLAEVIQTIPTVNALRVFSVIQEIEL